LPPEMKAAIILFFSLLDEQQRRLYAGLEAQKLGYGGDPKIAEFFGVSVHTAATRGTQPAVQIHHPQTKTICLRRKSCHQCRYEKEREGREFQDPGHLMARGTVCGK
jgi:hypothetical protein